MKRFYILYALLAFLLMTARGTAQSPPSTSGGSRGLDASTLEAMRTANLVVRVRLSTGGPIPGSALVKINSLSSGQQYTSGTQENSQVTFRGLEVGIFQIEVSAPGFKTVYDEAELFVPGSTAHAYITVQPESPATSASALPLGPPVLAPKAKEAVQKALVALAANDLKQAQKFLERARNLAPNHPQVLYLWGVLLMRRSEYGKALEFLRKSAAADSLFQEPHAAIGVILYSQNDYAGAQAALEFGLRDRTGPWAAHWALASLYYKTGSYAGARVQAELAGAASAWQKAEIHMILIQSLAALGEQERSMREMRLFLDRFPFSRFTEQVRQDLERMQRPKPMRAEVAEQQLLVVEDEAAKRLNAELPPRRWAPPDVDDAVPPVTPGERCSLPDVLSGAGRRAAALVESLERISATETIEHTEFDPGGNELTKLSRSYNYIALFSRPKSNHFSVEEWRNGAQNPADLPSQVMTRGLAAIAMVFHPAYQGDYQMSCEGLGKVDGQPMWQVHFRQRDDRPARLRLVQTPAGRFPLKLKGRAWLAANTFHVVRMVTDVLEPVPAIQLDVDHWTVDYRPVQFKSKNIRLWLPSTAELHTNVLARRTRQLHTFSDFELFFVEMSQKISDPKLPPPPPPPPS